MAAVLIPTEPTERYDDRPARPGLRLVPGGARSVPAPRRRESAAVYRRRRTVAAGLVAGVGIAIWLVVHAVAGSPPPTLGSTRGVAAHVYTVQPGDTLWSIAAKLEPNAEIRPLVDELNAEVHGQAIQPGQQLNVP